MLLITEPLVPLGLCGYLFSQSCDCHERKDRQEK
ncbi:MAG: hypothetical protein ACI8X3_001741, partial [Saprospiraceae bacterium]